VENFGPAAVSPVEDLLVDFPSRFGDIDPPFPELGALQVVVHFIFLPQSCVSRSVLFSSLQAMMQRDLQPVRRLERTGKIQSGNWDAGDRQVNADRRKRGLESR
jgi:hypothetical protein